MIIFKNIEFFSSGHIWIFGDIFLRKYITFFNSDSKTILFFKSQVNNNTEINDDNYGHSRINNEKTSKNSVLRTLLEIFMAFVILIILFLLYKKYRSTRKLPANELEDNNYEYKAKENKKDKISELFISKDE